MNRTNNLRLCIEKPLRGQENVLQDMRHQSNSLQQFQKLQATFYSSKLWPRGETITISFVQPVGRPIEWTPLSYLKNSKNVGGALDPIEYEIRDLSPVDAVKKIIMERIQPVVELNFLFVPKNGNIRIGFEDSGAWSLVGTDCLGSDEITTMNFGWLDSATVIHEMGHALGLIHEHQNPRGALIEWNEDAVYEWAERTQGWDEETTFRNIIEKYSVDQTNGSDYDPESIMLYFFDSKLTKNGNGTKQNLRLSKTDIKYLSEQYPGKNVKDIEELVVTETNEKTSWYWIIVVVMVIVFLGAVLVILKKISSKKTRVKPLGQKSDRERSYIDPVRYEPVRQQSYEPVRQQSYEPARQQSYEPARQQSYEPSIQEPVRMRSQGLSQFLQTPIEPGIRLFEPIPPSRPIQEDIFNNRFRSKSVPLRQVNDVTGF